MPEEKSIGVKIKPSNWRRLRNWTANYNSQHRNRITQSNLIDLALDVLHASGETFNDGTTFACRRKDLIEMGRERAAKKKDLAKKKAAKKKAAKKKRR